MSETPTPAMLKLGAAAAGGYVLGRFKKGRAAVGLALWLAGSRTGLDPRRLLREGLVAVLKTPEAQEVLSQVRGPVLQAGRRAAAATLESQAGALAKALEERTAALTSGKPAGQAEDDAGDEDADRDHDEYDEGEQDEDERDQDADRDEGEQDESEEPDESEESEESEEEEPEERRPRKAAAQQPRKRSGQASGQSSRQSSGQSRQSSRSAQESRTPRRPRKEGARS